MFVIISISSIRYPSSDSNGEDIPSGYLFDTFEGFPTESSEDDKRFKDTSKSLLKDIIGDLNNINIRKGVFPETSKGLENELFSFVMIVLIHSNLLY